MVFLKILNFSIRRKDRIKRHRKLQKGSANVRKEIVKVQGLQKKVGKFQALRDVTFRMGAREVVGVIGANGAGKSTTIRVVLGIIKRDARIAKIFGKDVWKNSREIHKRISYIPGDVSLWGNLTGGEIIDLFIKLHGGGDKQKRDYLIQRFELDPRSEERRVGKECRCE